MEDLIIKTIVLILFLGFTCLLQFIKYTYPKFFIKISKKSAYNIIGVNFGDDIKKPYDIDKYKLSLKNNLKYILALEVVIWIFWVVTNKI